MSRRSLVGLLALGGVSLSAGAPVQSASASSDASDVTIGDETDETLAAASTQQPNSADLGFLTDMTAHHVQALAMCQRVLGRETGDPVQAAAAEVLQNQAIEVGMMRAWLTDWGQSTATPELTMGWMTLAPGELDVSQAVAYCSLTEDQHDGVPLEEMNGYASDDDMRALALADGVDKGRMWLELMRAHHVGGVHMAIAAQELASVDKVIRLARIQAEVQTFEIAQYDELLAGEYA